MTGNPGTVHLSNRKKENLIKQNWEVAIQMITRLILCGLLAISFSERADAQAQAVAAEVCNLGACAPVDPATALIMIALAQLATELSKDDPFGKNNEIVKTLRNMVSDLTHGLGENNDLRKALTNIQSDLTCGPGPNNDIVKFLATLGIKISTHEC